MRKSIANTQKLRNPEWNDSYFLLFHSTHFWPPIRKMNNKCWEFLHCAEIMVLKCVHQTSNFSITWELRNANQKLMGWSPAICFNKSYRTFPYSLKGASYNWNFKGPGRWGWAGHPGGCVGSGRLQSSELIPLTFEGVLLCLSPLRTCTLGGELFLSGIQNSFQINALMGDTPTCG